MKHNYQEFEIDMQKELIKHYNKSNYTFLFIMIISIGIVWLDGGLIYYHPEQWWVSFSAGILFFNFILNWQQYTFNKTDLKFAKEKLHLLEKWKKEEESMIRQHKCPFCYNPENILKAPTGIEL